MRLLKVKSLDEGRKLLVELMESLNFKKEKEVSLEEALGYILAEDLLAQEDIPAFNRSTVDGFALKSSTTMGAGDGLPTMLKIVEDVAMGQVPKKSIKPGQASKVMTGGMLPRGADAMIMVEETETMGGDLLAVYKPARAYDHVVEIGDDCKKGDIVFSKGKKITPKVIASCASLGYANLKVFVPLTVRIVSTGDELVAPGEKVAPGMTRDVNSYALEGLCKNLGFEVLGKTHARDEKEEIEKTLRQEADIFLISGSSSQGDKDYLAEIVSKFTPGLIFHGLSLKPGKPTILASNGKSVFLGLPGHPVSSYIVFKALLEESLRDFYGLEEALYTQAYLAHNMATTPGRTTYQPVRLEREEEGLWAHPIFGASGNLSVLAGADGYFILEDKEEGAVRKDLVKVYFLD
ncbi:MAG TPA: molybdopterin molybdotransferase MoeA [Clostridia bacterium]|nr:molybdopterin molybdotransferase MoeA [Clostridia bacterium]